MNDIASLFTLVLRLALAILFATAALAKLRQRRDFYAAALAYQLLPPRQAMGIAVILPWTEVAIALGLIAGFSAAAYAAAGLLLAYALAMAVNLGRGRRNLDCGCGGAPQALSIWLVLRNIVLAGAALTPLYLADSQRPPGPAELLVAATAAGVLAVLYIAGHRLLSNSDKSTDK
jgi:uncharacterized membrane protein YphA (DoxX/SURF4 family)